MKPSQMLLERGPPPPEYDDDNRRLPAHKSVLVSFRRCEHPTRHEHGRQLAQSDRGTASSGSDEQSVHMRALVRIPAVGADKVLPGVRNVLSQLGPEVQGLEELEVPGDPSQQVFAGRLREGLTAGLSAL